MDLRLCKCDVRIREMCIREMCIREMCIREMCIRDMCIRDSLGSRPSPFRACLN